MQDYFWTLVHVLPVNFFTSGINRHTFYCGELELVIQFIFIYYTSRTQSTQSKNKK